MKITYVIAGRPQNKKKLNAEEEILIDTHQEIPWFALQQRISPERASFLPAHIMSLILVLDNVDNSEEYTLPPSFVT